MKTLRVDYEATGNLLTVPAGPGLVLAPVTHGDLYELQILCTRDGVPENMTVWTDYGLFITKTRDQFINFGDYTDAFIGFATSSSWWNPTLGKLAIYFSFGSAYTIANYYTGITVFKADGSYWTLGTGPLIVPVSMALYNAAASNNPGGVPGGLRGDWIIEDTATYFDVTVPNATANCNLIISVKPSTDAGDPGTITQQVFVNVGTPALSYVRISVGSAPGLDGAFNGTYVLERL